MRELLRYISILSSILGCFVVGFDEDCSSKNELKIEDQKILTDK